MNYVEEWSGSPSLELGDFYKGMREREIMESLANKVSGDAEKVTFNSYLGNKLNAMCFTIRIKNVHRGRRFRYFLGFYHIQ